MVGELKLQRPWLSRFNGLTLQGAGFRTRRRSSDSGVVLEASKGGTKVGRMKDPLYKDFYLGITPPTFILPFEAPESLRHSHVFGSGVRPGRGFKPSGTASAPNAISLLLCFCCLGFRVG